MAYCIASVSYPSVPLLRATDFLPLCTRGVLLSSLLFDRAEVVDVKARNKQNYIQLEMRPERQWSTELKQRCLLT